MNNNNNGWDEYKKLVMSDLKRLDESHQRTEKLIDKLEEKVAKLEVKSGIWGFIGGALVSIPAAIWALIKFGGK